MASVLPGVTVPRGMTLARGLGWLAAGLGAIAVLAPVAAGLWSDRLARGLSSVPLTLVYVATGAFVFSRRPDHPVSRRYLAFGLLVSLGFAVGALVSAERIRQGVSSWGWEAVLAIDAVNWSGFCVGLALFAVFPDGRYGRPVHRWLVAGSALLLPLITLARLFGQANLSTTQFVWGDPVDAANPHAVSALRTVGAAADGAAQAPLLMLAVGAALLALRYRRSDGEVRRRTAWPLLALVVTVAWIAVLGALSPLVTRSPIWVGYLLYAPLLLLIPAGVVIGMLRHQLLDVDLVVRRSFVYGVLWVLIAALYVGVAAALGLIAGSRLPVGAAILLTIAATVVAAPARRRLEAVADRLVFGRRQSGYELIHALGTRLESAPAPEDVAGTVAASIRAGLNVPWVQVGFGGRVVAEDGEVDGHGPAVEVPLVHAGERIGELRCGARRGHPLDDQDRRLLEALGRQTAMAIRNSQLADELSRRLEELAASRVRLVRAEDSARRRIERDIHDGVQQELVAVLTRLALTRNRLRREAAVDEAALHEIQQDTQRALEHLQDLARGIHPPVLSDRGLVDAVEERASRVPLSVTVTAQGLARGQHLHPDVESAAYFFVAEALANVLKHADAGAVEVTVRKHGGVLEVAVGDDGRGFAVGDAPRRGLVGLQDRVEALGGRVDVVSSAAGTTVSAVLPTKEASSV